MSFKVKLTEDHPLAEYLVDLNKIQFFNETDFLQKRFADNESKGGECNYKKDVKLTYDAVWYGFRGKFTVYGLCDSEGKVIFCRLIKQCFFPYLSTASIVAAEQCKFKPKFYKEIKLDYFPITVFYKIDY